MGVLFDGIDFQIYLNTIDAKTTPLTVFMKSLVNFIANTLNL